jgi:prevent-host-death family protein
MRKVGMHEAKTQLSRLVESALEGEQIVVTRRGEPAVRLVPERPAGGFASLAGAWRDQVHVAEDFDELPDDIADAFGISS